MKKTKILKFAGLILSVILLFSFASCGNQKHEIKKITITMTDEAKTLRDAMFNNGGNYYFLEEFFQPFYESVINLTPQPVPTVETENKMEVFQYMNQDIYTLTGSKSDVNVLYIHGGAWVYEITTAHFTFCDALATSLNAKVYLPIYDLAPVATYKETINFVESFYKELLAEGKDIYVMGDSAGGTIALDLIHALKEDNVEMPARLVLQAPASDLTFSNSEMEAIESKDPNLGIYGCAEFAKLWAGGNENLTNPAVSPLYADVSGYPKTLLIQGTDDILSVDNYKLCDKLNEAGVDTTLVVGEGLFHVFAVYDIPEKAQVVELITDFCK